MYQHSIDKVLCPLSARCPKSQVFCESCNSGKRAGSGVFCSVETQLHMSRAFVMACSWIWPLSNVVWEASVGVLPIISLCNCGNECHDSNDRNPPQYIGTYHPQRHRCNRSILGRTIPAFYQQVPHLMVLLIRSKELLRADWFDILVYSADDASIVFELRVRHPSRDNLLRWSVRHVRRCNVR